nr:hypothetical protein MmNV_16 [Menippe mercenaria nudivirus]
MDFPDALSVLSASEYTKVVKISEDDWNFVYSRLDKLCTPKDIKKLNQLKKYYLDNAAENSADFVEQCRKVIAHSTKLKGQNAKKVIFIKYLTITTAQVNLECSLCSQPKKSKKTEYSNVYGLMIHLHNSHLEHIISVYEKEGDKTIFEKISKIVDKTNYKTEKDHNTSLSNFQILLNRIQSIKDGGSPDTTSSSRDSSSCEIQLPDCFNEVHNSLIAYGDTPQSHFLPNPRLVPPTPQSPVPLGIPTDYQVAHVEQLGYIANVATPHDSSESVLPPSPAESEPMAVAIVEPSNILLTGNTANEVEFQYLMGQQPHLPHLTVGTQDFEILSFTQDEPVFQHQPVESNDSDYQSIHTPQPKLHDEEQHDVTYESSQNSLCSSELPYSPKSPEASNSPYSTICVTDLNYDKNHDSCNNVKYMNIDQDRSVEHDTDNLAKQHEMTNNRTIDYQGSDEDIPTTPKMRKRTHKSKIQHEPKAKVRKINSKSESKGPDKKDTVKKHYVTEAAAKKTKKEVLTKKPKINAKNSNGTNVPRSGQKAKNRDEENATWSHEFITSIEHEAAEKKRELQQNQALSALRHCVRDNVNVNPKQRKDVKVKINKVFKDFTTKHCDEKKSLDSRSNLAHLAQATVDAEYYGKKTNKTTNPFREEELERQIGVFVDFYGKDRCLQQTNLQVKKNVEDALIKKCKDTNDVNLWKKNLLTLKTATSPKDFDKKLDKLIKSYSKNKEIHTILTTIKTKVNITKLNKHSTELLYELKQNKNMKGRNSHGTKFVKNLTLQLGKGSLSNLKYVLDENDAKAYVSWFEDYKTIKESLSLTNNVKWFITCVESVLYGGNTPMNPTARISKTEVIRVFHNLIDVCKSNNPEFSAIDAGDEMFCSSFYDNLTIFCMKYMYMIYDDILMQFKTYPAKCQQPNLIHVGFFHKNHFNRSKLDIYNQDVDVNYNVFMKNQTVKKSSNTFGNAFGINRLILCLFQMKFIASGINITKIEDLKNVVRNDCLKIIEMIDSKCNIRVITHLKSMLFEVLYNIVCNIFHCRSEQSALFRKKITWTMFKNVVYDSKYYTYDNFAKAAAHSFPTIYIRTNNDINVNDDLIFDDDPRSWSDICNDHAVKLFHELYSSYFEEVNNNDADEEELETLDKKRLGHDDDGNSSSDDSSDSEDEASDSDDNSSQIDADDDDDDNSCDSD